MLCEFRLSEDFFVRFICIWTGPHSLLPRSVHPNFYLLSITPLESYEKLLSSHSSEIEIPPAMKSLIFIDILIVISTALPIPAPKNLYEIAEIEKAMPILVGMGTGFGLNLGGPAGAAIGAAAGAAGATVYGTAVGGMKRGVYFISKFSSVFYIGLRLVTDVPVTTINYVTVSKAPCTAPPKRRDSRKHDARWGLLGGGAAGAMPGFLRSTWQSRILYAEAGGFLGGAVGGLSALGTSMILHEIDPHNGHCYRPDDDDDGGKSQRGSRKGGRMTPDSQILQE